MGTKSFLNLETKMTRLSYWITVALHMRMFGRVIHYDFVKTLHQDLLTA